jgi:hypothetical protein
VDSSGLESTGQQKLSTFIQGNQDMRRSTWILPVLLAMASCGSAGDDVADKVEQKADNRADAIEQASEDLANGQQRLDAREQAELVREAGEERADAIREAQPDADRLTAGQKNAIIDAQ